VKFNYCLCTVAVIFAAGFHVVTAVADTPPTEPLLARYQRAADIQAAKEKHWIRNETVFPRWIPGRDEFWYDRETATGHRFTLVDASTGTKSDAFDHGRLATELGRKLDKKLDAEDLPLKGVRIDAESTVHFAAFLKHWRFDRTGNLSEDTRDLLTYAVSPDGKLGAFSKDNNLWVEDLTSGKLTQLTSDGEAYYAYGAAPAAGHGDPAPGVVWSPDSRYLFTAQTDDRQTLNLPVIDFAPKKGQRPTVIDYRAALPGDSHVPTFRLTLIDVSNGQQTPVRYQPIPAVRMNRPPMAANLMWWSGDSHTAYFVDIERGEKTVHVEAVDVVTGNSRQLFSETSETYVELGSDVYGPASIAVLPKSHQLIWYSERTGWAHLYLYDLTTGKLIRPLTGGSWLVRGLLGVDEQHRQAFVSVAARTQHKDPYYQEIARIDLDKGTLTVLSANEEDHRVVLPGSMATLIEIATGGDAAGLQGVAPSGDYFVETVSTADHPGNTVIRDRTGKLITTLETADTSNMPKWWRWPTPARFVAADGKTEISGVVFRPSDYDSHQRYPVIDYIYGGPQVSYVPKAFDDLTYLDPASIAELGFVVVIVDGRGTTQRSRAFHTESYGRVETASNVEDHIAAVRQLAERDPAIDASRVGITGFSGGGYMTASAMLRFPDFYKVGIAGSGNHDQRLFWNTWGERYEGYPVQDRYAQQANQTYANNLKGKLLLIHGLLDTGVHPSNVFQLEQALVDANKDFDMLLFPRDHHDMPGYGTRRLWDYFVTNLAGETPPREFKLKSATDYLIEKLTSDGLQDTSTDVTKSEKTQ
jgi:dipeptidyl aminopeptidase/acylaminoacyl peptidase